MGAEPPGGLDLTGLPAILEQLSTTLPSWLVVGLCLALSAFMSFAETCLTSLSESKVNAIMSERGQSARVLELWLREPHRVLVTILVGNTLANILATAVLTQIVLTSFGEVAVSWGVGAMTLVVLLFGEITPKTLARRYSSRAAVPTLHVLRILHLALRPVTALLTRLAQVVVRVFGASLDAGRDVSEAEVEALIDLGHREGILSPHKTDMLRSVFRLSDRSAREVMVARTDVVAVDLRQPTAAVVELLRASGHSRLPAHEGSIDDIVGILHAKDLLQRLARAEGGDADIRALLREPIFVPESMKLDVLLRDFRRNHQHLAVVLDEFGGMAGIATLEDVLEEVVGEIWDEHDEEESVVVRGGPGRWTVDGRLPVSVLTKRFGLEIDRDAPYDTLAGLLMDLLGEVPAPGTTVALQGYRFEVASADERRVGLVRIVRLGADGATPVAG